MAAPSPPSPPSSYEDATKMATTQNYDPEREGSRRHISIRANCAIQGIVATVALLFWQLVYTLPRLSPLILDPMAKAGTTPLRALAILGAIAVANLLHSVTFFTTLKHFPGGATSAGALKGLQAVLVFAASSVVLCGRWGGVEMCWSTAKGLSLVVVVCGILLYGTFTEKGRRTTNVPAGRILTEQNGGYKIIGDAATGDDRRIMCV